MAAKTSKIVCRKNTSNKQFYTTLKARNSKKEFTLGEGMTRKFTERDRLRLIKHLQEAVIEYK